MFGLVPINSPTINLDRKAFQEKCEVIRTQGLINKESNNECLQTEEDVKAKPVLDFEHNTSKNVIAEE